MIWSQCIFFFMNKQFFTFNCHMQLIVELTISLIIQNANPHTGFAYHYQILVCEFCVPERQLMAFSCRGHGWEIHCIFDYKLKITGRNFRVLGKTEQWHLSHGPPPKSKPARDNFRLLPLLLLLTGPSSLNQIHWYSQIYILLTV